MKTAAAARAWWAALRRRTPDSRAQAALRAAASHLSSYVLMALAVAMLACARLGIVHSEVFGGFSGAACGERIADSQSRFLITIDSYHRNGDLVDHKVKAD